MSLAEIEAASDVLREASESIEGEGGQRLREQAEDLAALADRDQGPDHGRVARHQQKLKDLAAEVPETASAVEEANDHLNAYRETIEGV